MTRTKFFIIFLAIFFAIIFTTGGFYLGYLAGYNNFKQAAFMSHFFNADSTGVGLAKDTDITEKVDFSPFWKTWQYLDENFVPATKSSTPDKPDNSRVISAISGLVGSYNDPFTVFIPKQQADIFKEKVNGEFDGIGAVLQQIGNGVMVTDVLDNSPAKKAGIKVGDIISGADNSFFTGLTFEEIVSRIRGPGGSVVSLSIASPGASKIKVISVTRGKIVIPTIATRIVKGIEKTLASAATSVTNTAKNIAATVTGKPNTASVSGVQSSTPAGSSQNTTPVVTEKQSDVFVLYLSTFSKSSVDGFLDELKKFSKSSSRGLVIDLRDNPGGLIDVAVDLASYFLPKDVTVVKDMRGKNKDYSVYKSSGYDLLKGVLSKKKVVVLVNGNSASASEILAGALQDNKAAIIVGERTFGKGSEQQMVDIGNLGTLKITTARWFTPNGSSISGTGITPDVTVNRMDPKYSKSVDPLLDAAVDVALNGK